jgi:hypothetical protein
MIAKNFHTPFLSEGEYGIAQIAPTKADVPDMLLTSSAKGAM